MVLRSSIQGAFDIFSLGSCMGSELLGAASEASHEPSEAKAEPAGEA